MTIDQIQKAMTEYYPVKWRGGEYIITAVITRYGRQPKMSKTVPLDWWYQIELTDYRAGSLSRVIVNIGEIEIKENE